MLVRCIVLSLDRFESQSEDVKGTGPAGVTMQVKIMQPTQDSAGFVMNQRETMMVGDR